VGADVQVGDAMKALSLWQPWASAIFAKDHQGIALKPDETRHWPTKVRGRIAIHAAKRRMDAEARLRSTLLIGSMNLNDMPFGCLIGTVEIMYCVKTETVRRPPWQEAWGNYDAGRYAFVLAGPQLFETPIPYIGRQGFFNVPDELIVWE
jgi:activating signal cointegrator 1